MNIDSRPAQPGTQRRRATHRVPTLCAVLVMAWCAAGGANELHDAIRQGDTGYLSDLLVNGNPDLVWETIGRGVSPMHLAAALNQAESIVLLVKHGAQVNVITEDGFTPLHWAASRDAVDAVQVLLRLGADPNALSANGITPLHWAANRGATNTVVELLANGADPKAETVSGMQPIHWAHRKNAEDAAVIIADRIVTDELAEEATNPPPAVVEAPDEPDSVVVTEPALPPATRELLDIYITPKGPDTGRALVVNIGLGEELVLEWIAPLKVWAGKYEVSNGQFRRFRPSHDSLFRQQFSLNGRDQPVVNVNWEDAMAFCEWLNRTYRDRLPKEFRFRLPYAIEWTLLARCGENRKYPWGNRWPPSYGNFADLTAHENLAEWTGITGYDDGFVVTCPVSQSGYNEWGIYGLAGNVWEWCLDWYTAKREYRVRRGGSWDFDTEPNLRINTIGFDRPEVRDDTIGFRVVASMDR